MYLQVPCPCQGDIPGCSGIEDLVVAFSGGVERLHSGVSVSCLTRVCGLSLYCDGLSVDVLVESLKSKLHR